MKNSSGMQKALISVPSAFLYEKPSENSMVADEVLHGISVWCKDAEEEGWSFVVTEYRYSGYIQTEKLCDENREWRWRTKSFIVKTFADIHSEPDIKSRIIETISIGARVALGTDECDKKQEWQQVQLANGVAGYVRRDILDDRSLNKVTRDTLDDRNLNKVTRIVEEAKLRRNITETARRYMGTQYRWGGKSVEGIDCSGLAFMAYFLNGIVIYRDSQIKSGFPVKAIKAEEAKEGDLLFFKGHVAVYLGNGMYIHSTTGGGSNGVVINSLMRDNVFFREDLLETLICAGTVF